jgi:dTDP-4-amino-4,6-dideoxygalactose transaminase
MSQRQFDLSRQHAALRGELDAAWRRVSDSSRFILGAEVAAFEAELAEYLGDGHVVAVNSGSDALYLALRLLGIGAGDEVVLPVYTFAATLEAILRVGAVPRFVDCTDAGFNADPQRIVDALSARTRAVIAVHLFGMPMDLSDLAPACREKGIVLVEDAAQALGATNHSRKAGTLADAGCFSFYPSKNLGALGDGGALWLADEARAARARRLRNHGGDVRGEIREAGVNSRLDEIQAAMLRVKLPHLDDWIAARRKIAAEYRNGLIDTGYLVAETCSTNHSFNQFAILHPERGRLRAWLQEHGVETRIYYERALHRHPAITATADEMPIAESRSREVLALPMYPELDIAAAARVCELIRALPGLRGRTT